MRRILALLTTALLSWWVAYPTGGVSPDLAVLWDLVDGPYNYRDQCIDAARWYNRNGDGNSQHRQKYFVCRYFRDR